MKKTLTININGMIFHIDEDAYESLLSYLLSIRKYFEKSSGRDEILGDIEARIAEIFTEKKQQGKHVITLAEVDEVIGMMGRPEEFAGESAKEDAAGKGWEDSRGNRHKRIYRDPDRHVLGGVCSGLGYYFGFDPVWLRIAFVLFFFMIGSGVLLYILLWIVIPEAKTSSEKLEMKGEPVNIGNIGKNIEEEMERLRDKLHEADASQHMKKAGDFLENLFEAMLRVILAFFKVFGKLIALLLVITGLILLTVLIFNLFDNAYMFTSFTPEGVMYYSWAELSELFFSNAEQGLLAFTGMALLVGIPLIAIVFSGCSILFHFKSMKFSGAIFSALFLSGLIMCLITGLQLGKDFSRKAFAGSSVSIDSAAGDTLVLQLEEGHCHASRSDRTGIRQLGFSIENGMLYLSNPRMDIERSTGKNFEIELIKSARGITKKAAYNRAAEIEYQPGIKRNIVSFSPCYSISEGEKWRDQELRITVKVPEGKSIYLSKGMEQIIYDIQNKSHTKDRDMIGHHWKIISGELCCTDCNPDK